MESPKTTSDPFRDQIRAAKAEGELAAIKDALAEFAEGNGFNPELEPRELLDKASGAFRSRAAISDMRYDEIRRLKEEIEAMRPRLMPEGMECPRYEDGEPVRIGDRVSVEVHDDGGDSVREYDVEFEKFDAAGVRIGSSRHSVMLLHGERVKRPAPKVLDADGVEIRVGDTVWDSDGWQLTVRSFLEHREDGLIELEHSKNGDSVYRYKHQLTHERPAIGADGKPVKEADTVWCVATNEQLKDMDVSIVRGLNRGRELTVTGVFQRGGEPWARFDETGFVIKTCYLTHEEPERDSWERIEEGVSKGVCGYFGHEVEGCCGCPAADDSRSCEEVMAEDVVRRCKALAGVERQ